jgi:hypothetical protein
MIAKLSKIALASIIFMPFNIITLYIAIGIKKQEGASPAIRQAIVASAIGTAITVAFIVACSILTPNMLGFAL